MTMASTPKQALPYPLASEKLADINDHIRNLALAIDGKIVMTFATQTALNTAIPSPTEGMLAYITDDNVLQLRVGSSWISIYPTSPAIYSGSGTPSSGLGVTGDIYVQT